MAQSTPQRPPGFSYGSSTDYDAAGRRTARNGSDGGLASIFRLYPLDLNDADDGFFTEDLTSSLVNTHKDSEEPLNEAAPFVHGQRDPTDRAWAWALACCSIAVVIAATALQFYRNFKMDSLISSTSLWNADSCPRVPASPSGRRLLGMYTQEDYLRFESSVLHKPWWLILWVLATLAATVAATTVLLRTFEAKAQGMVTNIARALIAAPVVAGTFVVAVGGPAWLWIPLFILGIANGICYAIWRKKLPLLGRLISIATDAIADNPNLVWVALFTQAILVCMYLLNMYIAFVASSVGTLIPSPMAVPVRGTKVCMNVLFQTIGPCCAWRTSLWVYAIQVPASLVVVWVLSVLLEAQTFVIAGTVCQWYFAPVSAGGSSRGNVSRSGKHLASSLGTMALAGLILWWVKLFRTFTYFNDRRLTLRNPLTYLCGFITIPYCCVCWCFTPCVEHITKYATHRAAMSGYSFFHASGMMYNTLRRNHLNAIGMGWLPPFVLRYSAMALSLTASLTIAAFAPSGPSAHFKGDIAFYTVFIILMPTGLLLLGIVDSLYLCFALDRDQRQCTHNELHDILTQAPTIGPLWDDGAQSGTSDGTVLGVPATMNEPAGSGGQQQYAAPPSQRLPQSTGV